MASIFFPVPMTAAGPLPPVSPKTSRAIFTRNRLAWWPAILSEQAPGRAACGPSDRERIVRHAPLQARFRRTEKEDHRKAHGNRKSVCSRRWEIARAAPLAAIARDLEAGPYGGG